MTDLEAHIVARWNEYLKTRTRYVPGEDATFLRGLTGEVSFCGSSYLLAILEAYTDRFPFASGAALRAVSKAARHER